MPNEISRNILKNKRLTKVILRKSEDLAKVNPRESFKGRFAAT